MYFLYSYYYYSIIFIFSKKNGMIKNMILIVGLGNPGKKYENTRHNIGFRIIDELEKKELSEKAIPFKPLTFMNNSGKAVKKLTDNLQLTTNNLWIIHDDIDLLLGKIRISKNRGAGGHKGVESIIRELKTKNFVRFRIGINRFAQNQKIEKFVLEKFTKTEEKIVKEMIQKTTEAIEFCLKQGIEKTMNKYNL